MGNEELNKKCLEFAGFYQRRFWGDHLLWWVRPDNTIITGSYEGLPDFTDPVWGIAHCFKWLVPKLNKKGEGTDFWIVGLDITFSYGAHQGGVISSVQAEVSVKGVHNTQYSSLAETPALALCKAIEKLIDNKQ